jgi:hypothetical protein
VRDEMRYLDHLRIAGTALKRWLIAQLQDAVAVSLLWLGGLIIIDVPLAPLWALLAFFLQFVPQLGIVVALVGPAITAAISGRRTRVAAGADEADCKGPDLGFHPDPHRPRAGIQFLGSAARTSHPRCHLCLPDRKTRTEARSRRHREAPPIKGKEPDEPTPPHNRIRGITRIRGVSTSPLGSGCPIPMR